ncbi:MAG: polyprenyl synthetase family protein [Gemmataceae bacterium]
MNNILQAETPKPNPIQAHLQGILPDLAQVEFILQDTLDNRRPGVTELIRHLENYKGKRLRPTLLLLTAKACGGTNRAHHVLGAVVEMIHTATLVHDDVLDSADTRRHVETVNAIWDNQTSILLGDYLFTHAFHLTSTLGDAKACKLIGEATNRVCEGELHQITQKGNLALTEDQYFDIIDAKTAELTSVCCRLGALYANEPDDVVESLARYGRYLGMAFQIADDVLDVVGQEHSTGKSLGTDLEQKKMTLPIIRLLATSDDTEIRHILSNGHPNKRDALQPFLEQAKAVEYAQERAIELAMQAQAELRCLPPSESRDILSILAEKAVHRNT